MEFRFKPEIPKFGIVLVLVVVLVLGTLGFRDRKETDVLQLICSVSLIAKRSGFCEDDSSNSESRFKFLRAPVAASSCDWLPETNGPSSVRDVT